MAIAAFVVAIIHSRAQRRAYLAAQSQAMAGESIAESNSAQSQQVEPQSAESRAEETLAKLSSSEHSEEARPRSSRLAAEVTNASGDSLATETRTPASILTSTAATPPRINSMDCSTNLTEIKKAMLAYATEHDGWLPTDLMSLEGFLDDPTKLVCPSDTTHPKPVSTNWSDFHPRMITYILREKYLRTNYPHRMYLWCSPHQNAILNDGVIGIYRGSR